MEMMEKRELANWLAFEQQLEMPEMKVAQAGSELLFRGVTDSEWPLTTTLERAGFEGMSFLDYYHLAAVRVAPAVETFTGVNWELPSLDEVEKLFRNRELLSIRGSFPSSLYRYLVYLRHHAFPSPLLDWTHSPYVAAFFAFRDDPVTKPEKRAIYAYLEMPEGVKGGAVGEPTMLPLGKYVRSHRRHFRQQSDYTICGSFDEKFGWHFHPHGPVFGGRYRQDYLWKFTLPSNHRMSILRLLNDYNLNAFSLFDTEETLLETMWLREQILKL